MTRPTFDHWQIGRILSSFFSPSLCVYLCLHVPFVLLRRQYIRVYEQSFASTSVNSFSFFNAFLQKQNNERVLSLSLSVSLLSHWSDTQNGTTVNLFPLFIYVSSRLRCDALPSPCPVSLPVFASSWFHTFAQKLNFQGAVGGEEAHEEGRTLAVRTAAITEPRDPEEATFLRGTGATRDFVQASESSERERGKHGGEKERKQASKSPALSISRRTVSFPFLRSHYEAPFSLLPSSCL